jgi:hypothetical protein
MSLSGRPVVIFHYSIIALLPHSDMQRAARESVGWRFSVPLVSHLKWPR